MNTNPSHKIQVPITQVIDALLDITQPFPARYIHRLSDLTPAEINSLESIWANVDPDRRAALMEDLEDTAENDTLVYFDDIAKLALSDSDGRVRATALRMLWESYDTKLIPVFVRIMKEDNQPYVRAAAAAALGVFVYLGELEEMSPVIARSVEDQLITVLNGSDEALVRRRALESLGFSGRPEIAGYIRQAFNSEDSSWVASALFAMGRSAEEQWEDPVLQMIDQEEEEIQLEAVRAAGQLYLKSAVDPLLELLDDPDELDEEVRAATIWSLSQIGGRQAAAKLEQLLEDTDDEDEADYIEEALENLAFSDEMEGMDLFAIDGDFEDLVDSPKKSPGKSNGNKRHKKK